MRRSISVQITDSLNEKDVLPDDFHLEIEEIVDGLKYAPGTMDGIIIYHCGYSDLDDAAKKDLANLLHLIAQEGVEIFELEEAIEEFCKTHRAITIIDDIFEYIRLHHHELDSRMLRENAERLALELESIECVKFGMILLELFKPDDMVETIANILGRYDEFTIFSIFLLRHFENGNEKILELSKAVTGWGRIHCIKYIEPVSAKIKDWILQNGVDNNIMPAYSGLDAFHKADVREILSRDHVTKEEMKAILRIISAMINEIPGEGIWELEDAEDVLVQVVEKASTLLPLELSDYQIINFIDEWQEENGEDDNPELDSLINEIFCDENVRTQIKEAAEEGKAKTLADAIGLT